ncbi:hypothetical protein GCM10007290_39210 [Providencia stuartii]|nr:hypothetical protein GCM10007290_39210 [Providencia thailandensis]
MKKRYTEEQIIKAIKQHEAGAKVDDICREMGRSRIQRVDGISNIILSLNESPNDLVMHAG